MKKRIYTFGIILCAALAVVFSFFYAKTYSAVLLVFTCVCVVGFLICLAGIFLADRNKQSEKPRAAYRKKNTYISRAEYNFLQILRSLVGSRYTVCTQVPLVSVIEKQGAAFRNELFRVVDYLIADAATYEPLLLIELNDSSHNRSDRKERDRKVAEICALANMPLISFTLAESYNTAEVKKAIFRILR